MAQTRAALRQKLSRDYLGDYVSGTATGAGSVTTLVDTARKNKPEDYYKWWYIIVTSGNQSGDIKEIDSGFAAATGTFTWTGDLTGAPGTATYELSRIDPAIKHAALNRAARTVSKYIHLPIVDISMVTGSRVFNGSFVHWTSGVNNSLPLGWIKSDASLTVTHVPGTPSGHKVRLTGGDYRLQTSLDFDPDTMGMVDNDNTETLSVYCDVLTSTTSHARIGYAMSGTDVLSGYHTGGGLWEKLSKESQTLTANYSSFVFVADITANATAEFTNFYSKGGPQMYSYPVPSSFHEVTGVYVDLSGNLKRSGQAGIWQPVTGWTHRRYGNVVNQAGDTPPATVGRIHDLALPHGYRMMWQGYGAIQQATSDTQYMEVEPAYEQYFLTLAAQYVYETLAADNAGEKKTGYVAEAERWRIKVREMEAKYESVPALVGGDFPIGLG